MTVAGHGKAVRVASLEEALAALRERGMRASAARRLALEALFAADGPVSAEAIADGLGGRLPRSDLASVYRNLEVLEAVGLVRHVHLGHGPGRYALAGPAREYLVCDTCDAVLAVDPADLDEVRDLVRDRFGYSPRFGHFPIVGRCARCTARDG